MPNWNDVLRQISKTREAGNATAQGAFDRVRRRYLAKLHKATGRNIICYYSGWLSKPGIAQTEINDEDKNGFMMTVHRLDRTKGLDLILHTPGGDIAATQSIVDYLHRMFGNDVRAIIPQIAMSAGTMIACSCREILMTRHSNLGPIDPHLNGFAATGIIEEFKRACDEVQRFPERAILWQAIIQHYPPTFLSQCQNAIDWSNEFVVQQLANVMFGNEEDRAVASSKANNIVATLTDYTGNKSHRRHINFDECIEMGLVASLIEEDNILQDLILTVHHSYMHALMNTASFKMIENHLGVAFIKQQLLSKVELPVGAVHNAPSNTHPQPSDLSVAPIEEPPLIPASDLS